MTTILEDNSIEILHFSHSYPRGVNPKWVYVNVVYKPLTKMAIDQAKHDSSEYEKSHVIYNRAGYEKSLSGLEFKDTEPDKDGFYTLEWIYNNGRPEDFSEYGVETSKDPLVYEIPSFPGIYRFQQYCINNGTIRGAISDMESLVANGKDNQSRFTAECTFGFILETFQLHWH